MIKKQETGQKQEIYKNALFGFKWLNTHGLFDKSFLEQDVNDTYDLLRQGVTRIKDYLVLRRVRDLLKEVPRTDDSYGFVNMLDKGLHTLLEENKEIMNVSRTYSGKMQITPSPMY